MLHEALIVGALGQFIPDLLLMRLYAKSAEEVRPIWASHVARLERPNTPEERFPVDSIVSWASWIHEFIHYIQYVTRLQGAGYFVARQHQATATRRCMRSLANLTPSHRHRPNLPLHDLIPSVDEGASEEVCAIRDWRDVWVPNELALALAGLLPPAAMNVYIEVFARKQFGDLIWPTVQIRDVSGTLVPRRINMQLILETEATLNTVTALHAWFPSRWDEIMDRLTGQLTFDNGGLAVALMQQGLGPMFCFVVDRCMEHTSSVPTTTAAKTILDAVNCCAPSFAGMTYAEILKHEAEIMAYLNAADVLPRWQLKGADPEACVFDGLWDSPLRTHLLACRKVRHTNPEWCWAPAVFVYLLGAAIPGPRVMFNVGTIADDEAYALSFSGAKHLSTEQEYGLELDRLILWAAREVATRRGPLVCPLCQLQARRQRCVGCLFIDIVRRELFFDPISGNFTTHPQGAES